MGMGHAHMRLEPKINRWLKLDMQVVGTLGAGKVGTALMTRLKHHWETEKLVYHGRLYTTSEVMHVSLHLIPRPSSDLETECPIRAGLCCTAKPGLPHSTVLMLSAATQILSCRCRCRRHRA